MGERGSQELHHLPLGHDLDQILESCQTFDMRKARATCSLSGASSRLLHPPQTKVPLCIYTYVGQEGSGHHHRVGYSDFRFHKTHIRGGGTSNECNAMKVGPKNSIALE